MNSTNFTFEGTRPTILVRILNPLKRENYCDTRAIVDTGAELSFFGSEMPSRVGLDLIEDSKGKIGNQGIGGGDISELHEFIIQVMTPGYQEVFWESQAIQVGCSINHKGKPGLLGVKDVLANFRIMIDFWGKTVQLTKH